ncbi:hypothetical protein [Noviherbaspirillum malthae]|uniref:hypothetical protein n=1 Tax=Noviherbaspirillum malthae TaxID=1260987 RepID=UPI00188EA52D|nr:hypothetical protein [Noviherbaspirillum malthae]
MNTPVKTKQPFMPNAAMLDAAEAVLKAMAILGTVRPIVEAYQTEILAKGQWKVMAECREPGARDEIITEPKLSFLMSDSDFAVYHQRCDEARKAAGLSITLEGGCPLLEAEELLRVAQRAMVDSMADVTQITANKAVTLPLEQYREFVDLTLRLLVPFIDHAGVTRHLSPRTESGAIVQSGVRAEL